VLVVGGIMEDKEINEAIEEGTPTPNGLPESPASANLVCWIDGFRTQLTVRDEKVKEVVKRLEYLISYAKEKGWKSTWKEEPKEESFTDGGTRSVEPTPGCPECSKVMIKRKGKTGEFWGCSGYPECKGTRRVE